MKIKQEKQKVLIVGSGVIGAYLSKLLLSKKKHVIVSDSVDSESMRKILLDNEMP